MFRRILVASDLSPVSEPAVRLAVRFAQEQDAGLIVLYAEEHTHHAGRWIMPPFEEEQRAYQAAIDRERKGAAELLAATVKSGLPGETPGRVELMVEAGRAAETIVRIATERNADVIIVGTHGRNGVLGSVAERVVRTAGRPVLVVPSQL